MIRVNIITEGQTEETFVRDILAPEFGTKEIFLTARSVETSRSKSRVYRGGLLDYEKAKKDILRWLKQDKDAIITTMFDLYALPDSFPSKRESVTFTDQYKKVEFLEEQFYNDIQSVFDYPIKFIPYIQLHEFEGLLFSDIDEIHETMKMHRNKKSDLEQIISEFTNPEFINERSELSPSKRLIKLYPEYDKITSGSIIAQKIGLTKIRNKCNHFNSWLKKIEGLKTESVR
jgi:acyl-CoA-binding protein